MSIAIMLKKNVLPILFIIAIIASLAPTSNRVHAASGTNLALNMTVTAAPFLYGSLPSVVDGIYSYGADSTRWSSYGSNNATDYLDIDFGSAVSFNQVRLYLFNDGSGVKPPASYNIQYWNGSIWVDAIDQIKTPTIPEATINTGGPTAANTLNTVNFVTVTSQKLKVVFTNSAGAYSGVVELEVFLAQSADESAASIVETQIEQLPIQAAVTLTDKTAITAARTAYNALTGSQQSLVTNLSRLEAAEAAINTLEAEQVADESAASTVETQIEGLPIQTAVTLTDKTAITAARTAYNALTGSQQSLVTNLSKLEAAEAAINTLEAEQVADESAASIVETQIEQLPIQAAVTLTDKTAITAARTAYTNLTVSQKNLVTNLSKLAAAEAAIAVLELKDVTVLSAYSNATGDTITLKLSSVLDETYSIQASKFQVIANSAPVTVTSAVYDSTDSSRQTLKLTFSTPVLLNATTISLSVQSGAFKTSNHEFNNVIPSRPATTFNELDLSQDNLIGIDDVVQMVGNPALHIDVNQDGVFDREDIRSILGQISTYIQ